MRVCVQATVLEEGPLSRLRALSFSGRTPRSAQASSAYPALFSLADILTAWNPDAVAIPSSYGQYSSLHTFDFSVAEQRAMAQQYREAELPFIVNNIANMVRLSSRFVCMRASRD